MITFSLNWCCFVIENCPLESVGALCDRPKGSPFGRAVAVRRLRGLVGADAHIGPFITHVIARAVYPYTPYYNACHCEPVRTLAWQSAPLKHLLGGVILSGTKWSRRICEPNFCKALNECVDSSPSLRMTLWGIPHNDLNTVGDGFPVPPLL